MAELVALLTSPLRVPCNEQLRILETLRRASWIDIRHVDTAQDKAAWKLLADHDDKTWSLIDCASFMIMRDHSITEALTTDHHLEQAGFTRLLK